MILKGRKSVMVAGSREWAGNELVGGDQKSWLTFWFFPVSDFSAQAFVGGLSLHDGDRFVDPSPIRTSLDSCWSRGKYIRPVSVRRESGGSDHSNRRVALWM